MLSRVSLLSAQPHRTLLATALRAAATTPASSAPAAAAESGSPPTRLIRGEPGKVRMGFIPEEWFQFFHKKTGVTGPYTFAVALSTYLFSKEIYVMEHEFYGGISMLILTVVAVKKIGPPLAKYLDKEIDTYEADWNAERENKKSNLASQIQNEENLQWSIEGQKMLVAAKRENVDMQLEACYRERLMNAYNTVKQRLDFQVEIQNIEQRIQQRNLVDWVVRRVHSSITTDQEKANIDKCIADLSVLAKTVR